MASFRFHCLDVRPEPYAAVPTLVFRLAIAEETGATVEGMLLRCQIQIDPRFRRYTDTERLALRDLFDEPRRWHQTLRPFPFASVTCVVPRFSGCTEVEMPVTCTYDFEVAASRFCTVLEQGEIPFLLLFSGSAFLNGSQGITAELLSWESETQYRLPVQVWQAMLDAYFPDSGWIRLSRETIAALQRFKASRGLPTWESVMAALLAAVERGET
jgi:hypothetical protein